MSRRLLLDEINGIDTALEGFARAHRQLVTLVRDPLYITARNVNPQRRVGLVSGGGSGHEPMHAGFVGRGMLDAAVPGRVFASPHNRQVFEASRAVAGADGVLHIVKNYTGDRINFGIAAERLRDIDIPVERVLVDDDIATENDRVATGRRGTGATVVIEKVLGGAADSGLGLGELAQLGADLAARSRSVAVATRAQTSTATGGEAFDLGVDEIEYGVGIHGERAARSLPRPPLADLISRMVDDVLAHLRSIGEPLLVLVNGLGAATHLELYTAAQLSVEYLEKQSLAVGGIEVGTFVPALDMSGFSITLSTLNSDEWRWWQTPAQTPTRIGGVNP